VSALLEQACEWACSLRLENIPADVLVLARAMLLSQLAAAQATRRHPVAARLMAASPGSDWERAAARSALLTMSLDWDESSFAGHIGHSSALPPLFAGASAGADGERILVAQVAAAEVAARLTAALTLGKARGQTAAHTHLAATVVGCGVALGMAAGEVTGALSLALAKPQRVLLPAFMASDAKFWVAADPILQGARGLVAASAGERGLPGLLEVPGGLLGMAEVPLPVAMSGYGERWHLRTLSLKRLPGCAYISAAVEAACELAPLPLSDIDEVEVGSSIFTIGMEAESAPFISGPQSPLPALNFSLGYSVAAALQQGDLGPADFHGELLSSKDRWELAGRVRAVHDPELTLRALAATAPIGMALAWAGERARPYLARQGGAALAEQVLTAASRNLEDPAFEHPAKRVGARLRVRLKDGRELAVERDAADGSCQDSAASRLRLAEDKHAGQLDGASPKGGLPELAGLDPAAVRELAAAVARI
jgi:2-methylcitrate dehydratase PrpD